MYLVVKKSTCDINWYYMYHPINHINSNIKNIFLSTDIQKLLGDKKFLFNLYKFKSISINSNKLTKLFTFINISEIFPSKINICNCDGIVNHVGVL